MSNLEKRYTGEKVAYARLAAAKMGQIGLKVLVLSANLGCEYSKGRPKRSRKCEKGENGKPKYRKAASRNLED